MNIEPYKPANQAAVITLWQACGLTRAWNDPAKDIARKLTTQPDGFVVGVLQGELMASAMFGYDGHRGWINYLAVAPHWQKKGYARALMAHGEAWLLAAGCPKLNLQLRTSNADAMAFYQRVGYVRDDVISLGKRLIAD